MNKTALLVISLFCYIPLRGYSLIGGSMQFPAMIKSVPSVRIYCGGHKISYSSCDCDNLNKRFNFQVPKTFGQSKFHILITESIDFDLLKNRHVPAQDSNTISNLKVSKDKPYKLYLVSLEPTLDNMVELDIDTLIEISMGTHSKKVTYQWNIKELSLKDMNNAIPDEAIIICFPAQYVEKLQGKSSSELPCIVLNEKMESEKKLTELSNSLILSSIDSDTIHEPIKQDACKRMGNRHIFAAPAA